MNHGKEPLRDRKVLEEGTSFGTDLLMAIEMVIWSSYCMHG